MKDNEQMAPKKTIGMAQPARRLDDKGQLARVRRICNELPGTVERIPHGEPTFLAPKRAFVMFSNNFFVGGLRNIQFTAIKAGITVAADSECIYRTRNRLLEHRAAG